MHSFPNPNVWLRVSVSVSLVPALDIIALIYSIKYSYEILESEKHEYLGFGTINHETATQGCTTSHNKAINMELLTESDWTNDQLTEECLLCLISHKCQFSRV